MLPSSDHPRFHHRRLQMWMLLGPCIFMSKIPRLFCEAASPTPGFAAGIGRGIFPKASISGVVRGRAVHPSSSAFHCRRSASATATRPFVASSSSSLFSSVTTSAVGERIPIDANHPGLRLIHSDPDVYVIEKYLDSATCDDLVARASAKGTSLSPVAYAGWTDDFKDLLGLAASGPVSWLAILGAWYEAQGDVEASVVVLLLHALRNYAVLFVVAAILVGAYTKWRTEDLQSLRTSSSTTLDDVAMPGVENFVRTSADLFRPASASSTTVDEASFFEAPTVIRYERDQALAPHYDANRSADAEDANRGGQTLATLLVYLNDVSEGGITRFGKLPAATDDPAQVREENNLAIRPTKGDALLFFPADREGIFDERTEHEGMPAVDEKWIARIWRHAGRVPPPFGLSDDAIAELSSSK